MYLYYCYNTNIFYACLSKEITGEVKNSSLSSQLNLQKKSIFPNAVTNFSLKLGSRKKGMLHAPLFFFFFLLSSPHGALSKESKSLCTCLNSLASLNLISLLERTGMGKEHEGIESDLCLEMSFVESQAKYKAPLVHKCFFGGKREKLNSTRYGRALRLKKALPPLNFRRQACSRDKGNSRHKGQSLLFPYLKIKCLC